MNVGEKIQLLRKKEGMSQEELGQKLLVSRQTVSLWETGQTFPTIDNLLRLKEIFSVSVDELIDTKEEVKEQNNNILPVESHIVHYDDNDAKEIFDYIYKRKRRMVVNVLVTVCILSMAFYLAVYKIGLFVFCIAALVGFGLRSVNEHKMIKKLEKDFLSDRNESLCKLDVYEDYFIYKVIKGDEVVKMTKIPYSQVEMVWENKKFYFIVHKGLYYSFNKIPGKEEPFLISKCRENVLSSVKEETNRVIPKWVKRLKPLLIVLSALSLFFALFAVVFSSSKHYGSGAMMENMWIMYLFAIIPLTSLMLGCIWRKKGFGGLANMILGGIMAVLLIIYGSFSWLIPVDHSTAHIESAEARLKIDFPRLEYVEMTDFSKDGVDQNYRNAYMRYKSIGYFDKENSLLMEKLLDEDGRFLKSLPSDFNGVIPYGALSGDYFMLYRPDTQDVNTLPEESGKYNCIYITYSVKEKLLQIMEYEVDYVK